MESDARSVTVTVTVNGQILPVVDKSTCLGSTLSRAVRMDDDVKARTAKASVAFCRLKESVKSGKQEPRIHHQIRHSQNPHALFATDILELKLAYTAINEHPLTHEHLLFRI